MGRYKFIAFAVLVILAAILAAVYVILPDIAHARTLKNLGKMGFATALITKPKIGFNALLYSDVVLDAEKISSVKYIKVTYDPVSLLLFNQFNTLDFIGLDLNGSWETQDYSSLSFSGWRPVYNAARLPLKDYRHISVRKSRLSVLTDKAGALSFAFDLALDKKGEKTEYQVNLKTGQKLLSFTASGSGTINGPLWFADLEILDGKFEHPDGSIKATRVNGSLNISARKTDPLKIVGEFNAGGLQTYTLPWQDASANLDVSGGRARIFSEAKAVGNEDIELELNLSNADGGVLAGGAIHAVKTQDLLTFFGNKPLFRPLIDDLRKDKRTNDITANFGWADSSAKTLSYSIEDAQKTVLKAGTLPLAAQDGTSTP